METAGRRSEKGRRRGGEEERGQGGNRGERGEEGTRGEKGGKEGRGWKGDSARDSKTKEGIGRRDSVGIQGRESRRAHTLEVSNGGQIG
eukprot:721862-Rhodomonas_salina.1